MIEIINPVKVVKARKNYRDDTREFIMEDWTNLQRHLNIEEIEKVEKAISEDWIIKKGELHEVGVFKYDDIYSFRCKIGLNNICLKYDLYPEN